jgi:DNA-directed RNA polymerase subunit omega
MIVKPTVNELLEHTENRYALVIEASKRARQIANGDEKLVETEEKSPVTIAANEIVEGKVKIINDNEEVMKSSEAEEKDKEEIEE